MSATLGLDSLLILPSELGHFGQVTLPLCATASGCKEVVTLSLGQIAQTTEVKLSPP